MTIPELNQRILGLALQHIGVREEPGARKNNPEILAMFTAAGAEWVSKDEVAWCSAFACYIAELAGAANPRTIRARRWLELAHADRIESIDDLVPGDLVVLWRGSPSSTQGHIAVFLGRQRGARTDLLWLIGGNQRDTVCPAAYPANQFLAGLRLHAANDVPFDYEVEQKPRGRNYTVVDINLESPRPVEASGVQWRAEVVRVDGEPDVVPASTKTELQKPQKLDADEKSDGEPAESKSKGKKKRATRKKGAKASE